MPAQTKERLVETSAELFRRQGFSGTGVKQIVAEASAPLASLYHFFPGGKEQLAAQVIRWCGARDPRLAGGRARARASVAKHRAAARRGRRRRGASRRGARAVSRLGEWWARGEHVPLELRGARRSIFTLRLGEGPSMTLLHGF